MPTGSRAESVGFLVAWFVLVAIAVQLAATVIDNVRFNWWPGYDTNAYWLAARHLLDGSPLYTQAEIWTAGAYKYPPVYAQLVFPIGFAPELLVAWLWRIGGVLCLRYLAGSWKLAVLAALQWPVFAELGFGNVTLQLGVVCLMCLGRGRVATAGIVLLPWFAGMKFGPALLLPYLWWTRPETRRRDRRRLRGIRLRLPCVVRDRARPVVGLRRHFRLGGVLADARDVRLRDRAGSRRSRPGHPSCHRRGRDPGRHPLAPRLAGLRGGHRNDADLLADAPGGPGRALATVATECRRPLAESGAAACSAGSAPRWSTWTCSRREYRRRPGPRPRPGVRSGPTPPPAPTRGIAPAAG